MCFSMSHRETHNRILKQLNALYWYSFLGNHVFGVYEFITFVMEINIMIIIY